MKKSYNNGFPIVFLKCNFKLPMVFWNMPSLGDDLPTYLRTAPVPTPLHILSGKFNIHQQSYIIYHTFKKNPHCIGSKLWKNKGVVWNPSKISIRLPI